MGFDSQVLFFVEPVLLQDCWSPGDQETTHEKTDFASGADLSAERLGKAQLKKECLVYARALPERRKTQSVLIKWQLLKCCFSSTLKYCIEAPGSYGTQT